MTAGVVTIGRRPYAVGLYWENSPSGRVSQAAREAARQPGFEASLYAVRAGNKTGRVPQFGLSQTEGVHKAGMPALAACLANQQPGSWVGAFRLREGVALIVVRDDLLVPDGDQFFLDETEARDRLIQEMTLGGLQRVYAPETWGISGADSMPLSLLLNDRADVRLSNVAIPKTVRLGMLAGAGLLVVVLAVGWYVQSVKEQEEAARVAQLQAIDRAKREAQRLVPGVMERPEYPPPERKWEKEPSPLEMINACRDALAKLPLVQAGWRLEGVRCDKGSINQKWARTGGFSAPPPHTAISDSALMASGGVPLEGLSGRGAENLLDQDAITKRVLSQNWPAVLTRLPEDAPPPPPPGYNGTWMPPPTPWVKRSFTVSAPALPSTLSDYFENIPGVVINSLSLNTSGGASPWSVEGVIYENRR